MKVSRVRRPTGRMERVSKQPRYFSKGLRKGRIARELGVDGPTLERMIKAGEVVLR